MTDPTPAERAPVLVRVPRELREAVRAHAERSGMSMNEYIVRVLQQADRMEIIVPKYPDSSNFDGVEFVARDEDTIPNLKTVHDLPQGDIKFEALQLVLYDTQFQINPYQWPKAMSERLLAEPPSVAFFQGPGGRGPQFTNVEPCGQLSWPKRATVFQVAIQFDRLLDSAAMKQLSVTLRVGEKNYLEIPVMNMTESKPGLRFTHQTSKIYIPPVQNFIVLLHTGDKWLGETEIRCELLTELLREVQ